MEKEVKKITEKVLELALNLDHQVLQTLFKQWKGSIIKDIELTGVGFYVNFEIPNNLSMIEGYPSFTIQGIKAEMEKLENDAGFAIFIKDGKLDMLECFTYDEPWPKQINNLAVSYIDGPETIINDIVKKTEKISLKM